MPSLKNAVSASPLMFRNGSTATDVGATASARRRIGAVAWPRPARAARA